MKIAMFKNVEFDSELVGDCIFESIDGYVRISEYIDVEFKPLDQDEVVNGQIEILKSAKDKLMQAANEKAGDIDRKISELLALPSPK